MSPAVRHFRTMRTTCAAFVLLIQTFHCLASDDSYFNLSNKTTGFCLAENHDFCYPMRWTSGDRIMVLYKRKCLGAQGKSVGSEINLYDCDEKSDLQKWECKNETVLALKGENFYIELKAQGVAVLSKTIGPNNHLIISGTSSGACTRTYREWFTIEGNAYGQPCMFPFLYENKWYDDCITSDASGKRRWCAVETKYDNGIWGFCPTNSKENWKKHPITGAYYQINTQSALTWSQAQTSCKQQSASLLSITDPHQQAYIMQLLGTGNSQVWTGLTLDTEHSWQWSDGRPYRYLKWDSGHPLGNPGHNCAVLNADVQYSWQSSQCSKKLGYICYNKGTLDPTPEVQTGFCSNPWIHYNGHCFHLNRMQKTWSAAQLECRKEGGDLVSIRNVEDQSFVISQLGFASSDELWIGLNDRTTEGLFDWSDHSTVTFTTWEFGEPAISAIQEDCVLIRGANGNWADRVCEEKHGFICMKPSASEPSGDEVEQNIGCKAGWKRHGSYCYFVGSQTKTFDEAKDDCKSSDSYLADVSNGVDNAFLVSLVGMRPEKYFWLGFSNQKHTDMFVWTNTDSVKFTHWNTGMPGHLQGCVAMTTGIFAGLWDVLPCTSQEKYICKHLAEGAVLTPVPLTLSPPKCAEGWSPVGSRISCFKVFSGYSSKKTWYEARDYCRAIGGDLLSIHSAAELQVQRGALAWIGLSAPDPATGYVWSDGTPLNFQHWEDGKPDNKNNVESCVEFKTYRKDSSGSWNDVHCESYKDWLCQIRAGVTPKPPPDNPVPDYNRTSDGWVEWGGNQYYFRDARVAMEDARHFCQQRHGDLVTINSEAERVFLWKRISRQYWNYYIGLTVDLDRTFGWMDGSPVVFQSWEENQPDFQNFDENCAIMVSSTGFWHDWNCGTQHKSICKRSGSPPINTTAAPTVPPRGDCPLNWQKLDSKCYSINTRQMDTWDGARKQCQAMGGNLASIMSRGAQVSLLSKMAETPTSDLWIGLVALQSSSYRWTDGRPLRYSNLGTDRSLYSMSLYEFRMKHLFSERHRHPFFELNEKKCVVINTNPSFGVGKWMPMPCNDTKGFVCLRNLDTTLPDSPEPPIPITYVKVANDSIKAVIQNMTWDQANKQCQDDKANLASLRNEWTQNYMELLALKLQSPLWIGLNKEKTGGYFRYTDGWHMSLANWWYGEPKSDRSCVYVDMNGKWKTAFCNRTMNSVCMQSTDVAPTESNDFPGVCPEYKEESYGQRPFTWLPFRGHCYVFVTNEKTWSEASVSCVQHGGVLASIEDLSEQEFLQRNVKTFQDSHVSFWLGLFKTHKGQWLWWDKTVMDYTNWAKDEPDDNIYGEISSADGTWNAGRQWYRRSYICKTSKVILPAPIPVPRKPAVVDPRMRSRIGMAVTLVIAGLAMGTVIVLVLWKKTGHRLPIPEKITTFDNPLFFNNERAHPGVVDTTKLIENAEEQNSEPEVSTELVVTG
ncbi:hypothetical protein LDENG_00014640 [Lucifuga dentata]|nr:hypothetical protein LDENG_00014640 [Lucifuga dentata]